MGSRLTKEWVFWAPGAQGSALPGRDFPRDWLLLLLLCFFSLYFILLEYDCLSYIYPTFAFCLILCVTKNYTGWRDGFPWAISLCNVMETSGLDFASLILTKMSTGHCDLLVIQLLRNRKGAPRASWLYRIAELVIWVQERDSDSIRKKDSNEWEQLVSPFDFLMRAHVHLHTHLCHIVRKYTCMHTAQIYIWRNKNFISLWIILQVSPIFDTNNIC